MKEIIQITLILGLLLALVACADEAAELWSENMQTAMEVFGDSLDALGELDADASSAEVNEVVDELDASWAEVQAVADAEDVDLGPLEEAMDDLEQEIRSAGNEPLAAQKGFLDAWEDAMSAFDNVMDRNL